MAGLQPGIAPSVRYRAEDAIDSAGGGSITKRFAVSARAAGGAVAVVQGDDFLTYAELDRRSNQLARFLLRQGIEAGSVVALNAGRSISSLVGLLGILKAGAAYAPLDQASPGEYRDWVVRDCGARLLLGDRPPEDIRPVPAMTLDAALAAAAGESGSALEDRARPADIAYVMYTSGSTGRPKGVRVPHRAVVRLVVGQSYARLAADEIFLHAAPLSFDASTFEIWGALLHGARLVVVGDEHASLDRIVGEIGRHHVTMAWFTAGLFHLLVEHQLASLAGLRQILAGGDVLSPSHVLRARVRFPNARSSTATVRPRTRRSPAATGSRARGGEAGPCRSERPLKAPMSACSTKI